MADTLNDRVLDAHLAAIDDDGLIRFTQRLVQIESINGNEAEVAEFVAQACRQAGLEVSLKDVVPGRPNVMAVLPGEIDETGLLLHGHTDTVPFFDMPGPVSGEIHDGYLWGRGSVDQKGGLAAAVWAVFSLVKSGFKPHKGIVIAAVIDEESEHRGSWALTQEGIRADFAITTEPSDLTLQVAHKGTAPLRADFTGVLAHGSNPWVGVNAIEMAARFVLALHDLELPSVEVPGVGTMRASYNVGLIEGGTQYNNVADRCSLYLDRRMVPGENQTLILKEVRAVVDRLAVQDPKFKAEVAVARPDWKWDVIRARGLNPSMSAPDSRLARAIADAHLAETGEPVELTYTHGYNDGDFINNDLGIPTVNYGPGESVRSHTVEEKLRLDHLRTAARVLLRTVAALTG